MTTIVVGIQNSILVLGSSNGFKIHESLKGTSPQKIAIDSRNPDRAYCATFGDGLWKTDDGGQTWNNLGSCFVICHGNCLTIVIIDIPRFIHRLGKFIYFLNMAFNATQITDLKFATYLAAGINYRSCNRCNNIGPTWENVYCH